MRSPPFPHPQCGSRRRCASSVCHNAGRGRGSRDTGARSLRMDICPSPQTRRPDRLPPRRARNPRPHRGEPLRGTLRGVAGVATRRFTRVCYTASLCVLGPPGGSERSEQGAASKPRRNRSPRLHRANVPASQSRLTRSRVRHRVCRPLPHTGHGGRARPAPRRPRRGTFGGALRSRGGEAPGGRGGGGRPLAGDTHFQNSHKIMHTFLRKYGRGSRAKPALGRGKAVEAGGEAG